MAAELDALDGASSGGGKGLIITLLTLLALGGGGFGAWMAFKGKTDGEQKVTLAPPRYVSLDPPFVVNFQAETVVRFLQVSVGLMTRDPRTEEIIRANDPRVRNDMLMILSGQNYAQVATAEGKEELRQKCLEALRAIIAEMQGEPEKLEALYFTSFVMQ